MENQKAVRQMERRIKSKRAEVQNLENQLSTAKAYLSALIDSLGLFTKSSDDSSDEANLREGTDLARVRDFLKKEGKPVHINLIMKALEKESTDSKAKVSLTGSLGSYVRKKSIFTRPKPNTFGLIDLDESVPWTDLDQKEDENNNLK